MISKIKKKIKKFEINNALKNQNLHIQFKS